WAPLPAAEFRREVHGPPAVPVPAERGEPVSAFARTPRETSAKLSPRRLARRCPTVASFRGREGDVRDSGQTAYVEHVHDVLVGARFVAADHDRLVGIESYQALQQCRQIRLGQAAAIHDDVAVSFHIHDHVTDWRGFFLGGAGFRNLYIELVFVARRVPGEEEKNKEEQQHVDQRCELDAGMLRSVAAAKVHLASWRPGETQRCRRLTALKIHLRARPAGVPGGGWAGPREAPKYACWRLQDQRRAVARALEKKRRRSSR